jgi:hypothetical protein
MTLLGYFQPIATIQNWENDEHLKLKIVKLRQLDTDLLRLRSIQSSLVLNGMHTSLESMNTSSKSSELLAKKLINLTYWLTGLTATILGATIIDIALRLLNY